MALRRLVTYGHHFILYHSIAPQCITHGYDCSVTYMDPQCTIVGGYISLYLCYIHLDKAVVFLTILSTGLLHRSFGSPPSPVQNYYLGIIHFGHQYPLLTSRIRGHLLYPNYVQGNIYGLTLTHLKSFDPLQPILAYTRPCCCAHKRVHTPITHNISTCNKKSLIPC